MPNIKVLISQRLNEACDRKGLNPWGRNRVLAKELQISPAAVSKWFADKSLPTIDKFFDLSRYLGVRPEWLATGKPPMSLETELHAEKIAEAVSLMENLSEEQIDSILHLIKSFGQQK